MPGAASAAAALGGIAYASMAIITFAYPSAAFPQPPEGSGYLVPAVDGHPVKAVTFSSVKWPHLQAQVPGLVLARCSVGRIGEEGLLQRDDEDLAAVAAADLAAATGVRGAPSDTRVTRWGAPCPSTGLATGTGWPRSGRRSPPSPGWPSAAPPTMGLAFPPASPPRSRPSARSSPRLRASQAAGRPD